MITYHLPADTARIPTKKRAVALGLFDGLHSGHRAVIAAAIHAGDGHCAVYTFSPSTLYTKGNSRRLCAVAEQDALLDGMGVTEVFETDFAAVCALSPAQFVKDILHDTLHATAVTCGFNYRFGKDGAGDTALLTALCAAYGIAVTVVEAVTSDGDTVSSTAIRAALADGDMATVRRMLNRAYCLALPVGQGQHLGRTLGMPTLNQTLPADLTPPRFGVYAACAEIDGKVYAAVTNIGVRPTVGADAPLAETWVFDFSSDVYDKTVKVYPITFLRAERTFDSLEALRAQVAADAAAARALFAADGNTKIRAVLFDFDDTLHRRDAAFAIACDRFMARHYPSLDEATHKARVADMIAFDDYGYHRPLPYPAFIERYLTRWDGAVCTDAAEALHTFFADFAAACVPCEGVIDTLIALRRRGLLIGIITNGDSFLQNHKLDFAGLRSLCDLTVVSCDEGVHKPRAEIFRHAAMRLGLPCEACMYVGDHPINDIGGARAAGMTAVRIDYGFPPDYPVYDAPLPPEVTEIHRFDELLTLPDLTFCSK